METLGSLIDKFSIARLRMNALERDSLAGNPEKWPSDERMAQVGKQVNGLKDEIDGYIHAAIKGDMKLEEPKFKMYAHEKPADIKGETLGQVIEELFMANYTLWGLEDQRRDPEATAEEIKILCDHVATYNRLRNDCMDEINKKFSEMVHDRD